MLLTLPAFLPIIKSLGYHPVWFGILFNINMQIALPLPTIRWGLVLPEELAPTDITMEEIFAS
jgi:TRAP-type mannitol/chloroaromatic compound transport system permease large subunit